MSNYLHELFQSAYRKFHSTETALLKVNIHILEYLDQGIVSVLVMLELSAAFDIIDHQTLLQRLEQHFGITGTPRACMTLYLSDRVQTVCVDGELLLSVWTCNVETGLLLCTRPWTTDTLMNKVQRVQNTATHIVTKTARHNHITPVLKKLHYLPVKYRAQYKLLVHTYKALHD